jgi:hypothetical protein
MALQEYGYTITTKDNNVAWNPTEYKILAGNSGSAAFGRESSQGTVTYSCEYFFVGQFLDVVLGKTVKGAGGYLKRSASSPNFDGSEGSTPEAHPWVDNLYAQSASIEPVGRFLQQGDRPVYEKAKVTVAFRPVDFNVIPDASYAGTTEVGRYVTKMPSGSAEFQTSQGQFKFVTDPQRRPLDIQPGFVVPAQQFVYTWRQIPVAVRSDGQPELGRLPNLSTIQPLVGTVNQVAFDGYPPGTVLYSSFTPTLVLPQLAGGGYYWDIAYTLGIRDYGVSTTPVVTDEHVGWNYAYDPTRHLWDLYTDTGLALGRTMYRYASLDDLFRVTW